MTCLTFKKINDSDIPLVAEWSTEILLLLGVMGPKTDWLRSGNLKRVSTLLHHALTTHECQAVRFFKNTSVLMHQGSGRVQ